MNACTMGRLPCCNARHVQTPYHATASAVLPEFFVHLGKVRVGNEAFFYHDTPLCKGGSVDVKGRQHFFCQHGSHEKEICNIVCADTPSTIPQVHLCVRLRCMCIRATSPPARARAHIQVSQGCAICTHTQRERETHTHTHGVCAQHATVYVCSVGWQSTRVEKLQIG